MKPWLTRIGTAVGLGSDQDPDRREYRRSAVRIGLRVAVVSAALVVSVVALVVAYVAWQLTPAQQLERHGAEDVHVYLDTVDLLIAVLVVGGAAVVLAGWRPGSSPRGRSGRSPRRTGCSGRSWRTRATSCGRR